MENTRTYIPYKNIPYIEYVCHHRFVYHMFGENANLYVCEYCSEWKYYLDD